VLPLLEQVSRNPELSASAALDTARAAGVPDEAIVDALHVSLVFNTINRLVNTFGLAWDSDRHVRIGAKVLHRISYRVPRFLTR
jgi:hypothetical protein